MPALPLDEAGIYVAAAYVVFLVLVVAYVSIMARHVARVRRDLAQLTDDRQPR
jgi:type II secretory pathway component PulM